MDENRRKIRDKGTITKIVGHKFTVFSLEDQSRAKINMLLEIVYNLTLLAVVCGAASSKIPMIMSPGFIELSFF